MSWLCRIGLHRWVYGWYLEQGMEVLETRCRECERCGALQAWAALEGWHRIKEARRRG